MLIAVTTGHGMLRARKRLGLSRRAAFRQVNRALNDGLRADAFTGMLQQYLVDAEHHDAEKPTQARVYGEHIYIFDGTTLITVLNVPCEHRGELHRVMV